MSKPHFVSIKSHSQFLTDNFIGLEIADLKNFIRKNPSPRIPGMPAYKQACVFLLMFDLDQSYILAIQKTDSEGYPWRNQVALPGGHLDVQDASPREGAFRELKEEVSISRDQVVYLGSMGHFQTVNRRNIEVFTGLWNTVGPVRPDPIEISRILYIPLRGLVQTHTAKNFHDRLPDVDELKYPFEDVVVWGATARILHHLIEIFFPWFRSLGWTQGE